MTKHNEGLGVVSWSWGRGVGRGGLVGLLLRVDSGSLVGDISDVSVIAVGAVLHVLDSTIGKSNGVSTLDIAGTIGSLLGVEVGLGVVIGNGVGEGVGGDLVGVSLSLVGGGRSVGRGSNNHGLVDGVSNDGGVDGVGNDGVGNGVHGMVDHGGVDSVDSVVHGGVVEHVLHSSIRTSGSNGEESSSNKSLKYRGIRSVVHAKLGGDPCLMLTVFTFIFVLSLFDN